MAKRWIEIPNKSGIWKAEDPGDTLEGKYLDRIYKPFKGRPNWKYCLESEHPLNVDGKISFFGTDGLNSAMEDVPKGYKVKIVYEKTLPNPDPQKKGFKVFHVFAWMDEDDELYKKLYPDDGEDNKPKPELQTHDHTKTDEIIDQYREILESEYKTVTCEAIIRYAETDPDLKPAEFTNIKVRLVDLYKRGEIKSEKKQGGK